MPPRNPLTRPRLGRTDSGYALKFKLVGDWEKTIKLFGRMGPAFKEASILAQLKLGMMIVKKVKDHLRHQDLGWPALSIDTIDRKDDYDLDSRILIATGTYLSSISTWRVGNQNMVMIGVKRGIYTQRYSGKKSTLDVSQIAVLHEFSSGRRFPRRPLWNPTLLEIGRLGMYNTYLRSFKAHLRIKGIPISNI